MFFTIIVLFSLVIVFSSINSREEELTPRWWNDRFFYLFRLKIFVESFKREGEKGERMVEVSKPLYETFRDRLILLAYKIDDERLAKKIEELGKL